MEPARNIQPLQVSPQGPGPAAAWTVCQCCQVRRFVAVLPALPGKVLRCPECEADLARSRAALPRFIDGILAGAGMQPDQIQARLADLDPRLAFHLAPLERITAQEAPRKGLGLIGRTGRGKSFALAAIVRAWVERWAPERLERFGCIPGPWPVWAPWIRTLDGLKDALRARGPFYAERMEALTETPLLVLDDLGAGQPDQYGTSWGSERLLQVVDARHDAGRCTLWASNLTLDALHHHYGPRVVSRLEGMSPAVIVPEELRDRRLARQKGSNA